MTVHKVLRVFRLGRLVCFVLICALVSAQSLSAGPSLEKLPSYVYPFPVYADPRAYATTDAIPPIVFLSDMVWPNTNDASACRISATATSGRFWLSLASSDDNWQGGWRLGLRGGEEVVVDVSRDISFTELPRDVYTLDVLPSAATSSLPVLWVAWPTNTIPSRRFPAGGSVHGRFENASSRDVRSLHVWGRVSEPVAAALWGGCGVTQAWLQVDGRKVAVTLDNAGSFDQVVQVKRNARGVHEVALWTLADHQRQAFKTDVERVSQYSVPFGQPPSLPDRLVTEGWLNSAHLTVRMIEPIPSGAAVAFPRLDSQGFLVFDGSESRDARSFRWSASNLWSGAVYRILGEAGSTGRVVPTEQLPAGVYSVTLDCRGWGVIGALRIVVNPDGTRSIVSDPDESEAVCTFVVVIPPRIPPSVRGVGGAVHARWTPERVDRRWIWSVYLSGHMFDSYGASVLGHNNANLEGVVFVNGQEKALSLDDRGCFLERCDIGSRLERSYLLQLYGGVLDNSEVYHVDVTSDTSMQLFSPWPQYYRLVGGGQAGRQPPASRLLLR